MDKFKLIIYVHLPDYCGYPEHDIKYIIPDLLLQDELEETKLIIEDAFFNGKRGMILGEESEYSIPRDILDNSILEFKQIKQ